MKSHKEIKKVTPNFWLHLIEQWEYRDAFYWYYGIPGFGPTRSILIFITQIGISTLALFFGSILANHRGYGWWYKMFAAIVINCFLTTISIKMLQCTNKRHTLSQRPKSWLWIRRCIGYSTCLFYWGWSTALWFRWCKDSGYMTDNDEFGEVEARRLVKDWMLMLLMDIPALLAYSAVMYVLHTNLWLQGKNTVSLWKYRKMVHHNRKVQLAKEAGISAIERDTETRPFDYVGAAFDNGNDGIVSI